MNAIQPPPQRFRRCPDLRQRETAQSFLGRLTQFFGNRNPTQFCADFGLDLRGIMHGEDNALQRLADLTGAAADELIRWTPKRIDGHFMLLNGEVLNTRDNPRRQFSMCPVCAREDIAAHPSEPWDQAVHGRAEWMIKVVDTCAIHGVRLITHRGPALDAVRLDQGYEATVLLEALHGLEIEKVEPDDFQLYVLSRVGFVPARPSPLLDTLPLAAVIQVCSTIGYDRLKGEASTPGEVDRRKAGFDMLGHGEATLEKWIVELRQGSSTRLGATRLFRNLLRYLHMPWTEADPDFVEFLDRFVPVLFRTLPYGEGQSLLGRECKKRSIHDFTSAKKAYGLPAYQLRAFLAGTPELVVQPFDRPQDALIDVEVADRLFLGKTPFLNISAVGRKFGRTGMLAWQDLAVIKKAGLIREAHGAAVLPRNAFYSEPEIEGLFQRLVGDHEQVDAEDKTMVSIYDLAFRFGVNNHTFWDLVAAGRLTRFRMAKGMSFIDGLRVDLAEAMTILCGVGDAMTRPEVCRLLGVDPHIVYLLEGDGVLRAIPADPEYSNRLGNMFDGPEVRAFRETHLSLYEVRQSLPGRPSLHRLGKMGLEPAIHIKSTTKVTGSAVFYRRDDVMRLG